MRATLRRTEILFIGGLFLASGTAACTADAERSHLGSRAQSTSSEPDAIIGSADYRFHFENLEGLVAASHLVIKGTVTEVSPGRTVVPGENPDRPASPGEEGITQIAVVRIESRQVLSSSVPTVPPVIKYEQQWKQDGRLLVIDGIDVPEVGVQGMFFLRLSARRQVYEPINNQFLFIAQGSTLTGSDPDDPLVKELNKLSLGDLMARVGDVAARIARGEIQRIP